jgi:hypothetical protein
MAQIVLSGDELIGILHANELIPDQVTDVKANGDELKLKVRTPWPVLKSVRVRMRFTHFDDGNVVFQLVTNRLVDTFGWLVDKILASLRLTDYGGRWEYPCLYVDVNKLVQQRMRGVYIDDMVFQNGHFYITTTHPYRGADADDTLPDTDADSSYTLSL